MQKVTIDVPAGLTYTFEGEIGLDPALPESTPNIALTKSGPGTQVLSGANTFAGGLKINEGTLRIGASTSSATAVGSGVVSIGTNTTNGTLDLNGQTEIINGLTIGASAAPNSQIIGNSSLAGDATLVSNGTSTFGGIIQDSVGGGTRRTGVNVGAGTLTLTNANTFTGDTNVMGGALVLAPGGSLASTTITVASGAALGARPGASSVSTGGSVTLENGSVLDMVDGGIGVFNITGAGTGFLVGSEAGGGAMLNFELNSGGADRITISNAAAVTGTNTIGLSILGSSLTPASTYTLISAASGLNGTFQFPNGSQQTALLVGTTSYQLVLANSGTEETVSVMNAALRPGLARGAPPIQQRGVRVPIGATASSQVRSGRPQVRTQLCLTPTPPYPVPPWTLDETSRMSFSIRLMSEQSTLPEARSSSPGPAAFKSPPASQRIKP